MQSALGNPWNPMPGWRYPGLQDEALAPRNTLWNRGVFDAVGVPYAFAVSGNSAVGGEVILRRVIRVRGFDAVLLSFQLQRYIQQYGEESRGEFMRMINDQFCWDRNQSSTPPAPFWVASPQTYPRWESEEWVLTCNANIPPGAVEGSPPDGAVLQPGQRPFPRMKNGLNVWSFYPRKAPFYSGAPGGTALPYNLWQSQLPGTADSLPADVPRAGVFPFPELTLYGVTGGFLGGVYGSLLRLTPYNP